MSDRTSVTTTLPHLISAAISVAYEKHQQQAKQKLVKPRYKLCSADCLSAQISAEQTNFSELSTGLLRSSVDFVLLYSAARSSEKHLNCCRMNKLAVSSSEKHSNSAQNLL